MAGWIAAAIYLVCVVAPPVALALGSGPAPCLAEDMLPVVMPAHADGDGHDHGSMHAHHHLADQGAPSGHHHHHDGKGLPGPCCVMLCAVAMVANLPSIAEPLRPAILRVAEAERTMAGRTPPLLYRPPIA